MVRPWQQIGLLQWLNSSRFESAFVLISWYLILLAGMLMWPSGFFLCASWLTPIEGVHSITIYSLACPCLAYRGDSWGNQQSVTWLPLEKILSHSGVRILRAILLQLSVRQGSRRVQISLCLSTAHVQGFDGKLCSRSQRKCCQGQM
jgi:hypothetical protein